MTAEIAAWIELDVAKRTTVLENVLEERGRQEADCRDGVHPFTCANPKVPSLCKLPVLLEEVGEVAEVLQAPEPDRERLYNELIQVAAAAVAWAESLREEGK